jgi:hypothetical protein
MNEEEIEEWLDERAFWNWKSPEDVKNFVKDCLERNVYEYAWGTIDHLGEERFHTMWWESVEEAIEAIVQKFSEADLRTSIGFLLQGEFDECDPAIFDALLKHVPEFPRKYPEINAYLESVMPKDSLSDWWEFSWYPFNGRYFTWTFWGPETMARSTHIDPIYLTRIFNNSIRAENPYRTFRARVALASNSNCPKEIVEFLWNNRDSENWLLRDYEEEDDLIANLDGTYVINSKHPSIQEIKDEAKLTLDFQVNTNERWDSGPGAQYVEGLLDIQWEADSARTCLLAALAKNTNLSQAQYADLYKENHPLIRYFLSKNPSLQEELKVALVLESPTFTFTPYEDDPKQTEEVTLR